MFPLKNLAHKELSHMWNGFLVVGIAQVPKILYIIQEEYQMKV